MFAPPLPMANDSGSDRQDTATGPTAILLLPDTLPRRHRFYAALRAVASTTVEPGVSPSSRPCSRRAFVVVLRLHLVAFDRGTVADGGASCHHWHAQVFSSDYAHGRFSPGLVGAISTRCAPFR